MVKKGKLEEVLQNKLEEVLQNKEITIEKGKSEEPLRKKGTSVIPWQHLNEISGNNLFVPKELIPVLLYLLDSYNKDKKKIDIDVENISLENSLVHVRDKSASELV